MPSDILNSLQKSMLLNPVKKEQKGYFRKKTEQQKWDGCKHFYENTGRRWLEWAYSSTIRKRWKYDSLKVDNNFWNYFKVWKNIWNPVNKLTLSGESVIIIRQQDNQTWSDLLVSLRKSGANPELFFAVFNVKRGRHYQSACQHVIKDRDSSNYEALFFAL